MKSYTSLEQSKKLLELGLSPETADAFYLIGKEPVDIITIYGFVTYEHLKEQMIRRRGVPCWSLAALLDLMPQLGDTGPTLEVCYSVTGETVCCIEYWNIKTMPYTESAIDCCYDMVCWLLENGYINKEEKI